MELKVLSALAHAPHRKGAEVALTGLAACASLEPERGALS
jgi:hypothetical protein